MDNEAIVELLRSVKDNFNSAYLYVTDESAKGYMNEGLQELDWLVNKLDKEEGEKIQPKDPININNF